MRKRTIVITAVVAAVVAVAGGLAWRASSTKKAASFQYGEITRGDIVNTVSSTGTLSAVNTVEVGAQVSGIIERLFVDFNSPVKQGQVLAVLDTTIVAAQVFDARAGMLRSKAQLDQAQAEYDRNKPLYENGYLSATEFISIKTSYDAAVASYQSAEAALKRAQKNLEYTTISSPITGTVIQRNVDAGQTIQASFQAPTLFIIATDMKSMQIEVNVDESDIGLIKEKQDVRFTVQAYPDEIFTGTVRQVRLQPVTLQNVVNYVVVVDASNESGHLLPGMTATVDFIIDEKKGVLLVPNSAIQFKGDQELIEKVTKEFRERMAARRAEGEGAASGEAAGRGGAPGAGGGAEGTNLRRREGGAGAFAAHSGGRGGESDRSRVFYLNEEGEPALAFFVPGATDGKNTEVKESRVLAEGMQVIIGKNNVTKTANAASNPFGMPRPPGGSRGGRRGPGF